LNREIVTKGTLKEVEEVGFEKYSVIFSNLHFSQLLRQRWLFKNPSFVVKVSTI